VNVAEATLVKKAGPLAGWLREHGFNLKESLLQKSKFVHHAYEEGHRVVWDEARILEIDSKTMRRK
jgi:hypothetical protein